MKRFMVIMLTVLVLCLSGAAFAETTLTSNIVQPTIDRFVVNVFQINAEANEVSIVVQYGYDDTGTFVKAGGAVQFTIGNQWVKRNNRFIARANAIGEFPAFPVAYQTNPADEVISQSLGQASAGATLGYLETVVKTLGGL